MPVHMIVPIQVSPVRALDLAAGVDLGGADDIAQQFVTKFQSAATDH